MFNRFLTPLLYLCILSSNVSAANNPFAKNKSLNVGKDISWQIDKKSHIATKTIADDTGDYYHLQFNNRQLKLIVSSDAAAAHPKSFSQLEIKDVLIDGKQSPLFKWCLVNQQRHGRFLQQGLTVKKNICSIDGSTGSFTINLNKDTLTSLREGKRLMIMVKPFRTPLDLNYDISDFKDMYLAMNAKPAIAASPVAGADKKAAAGTANKPAKKCWAGPPARYKKIKAVEYDCNDAAAKTDAEARVTKLVQQASAKEKELAAKKAAEREKQRKLAEERKQKALAVKLEQEKKLEIEAAAIAASQAKQAQIGGEIAEKMLKVCKKYWDKGEHRCYCQKYIDHAPASIQASSTCE